MKKKKTATKTKTHQPTFFPLFVFVDICTWLGGSERNQFAPTSHKRADLRMLQTGMDT